MCLEAHCVLGFIFSLTGIFRASFSKDEISTCINIKYINILFLY